MIRAAFSAKADGDHAPPPLRLLIGEAGALVDAALGLARARAIGSARCRPAEIAQPVMVVPGFLADDRLTAPLRRALAAAGHETRGWGLGPNRLVDAGLLDRVSACISGFSDRPVALVGWSLGGLIAREVAKRVPDRVERVVTLGSPFSGDPRANHAWRLYERVNGHPVDRLPIDTVLGEKPPVPTIALWSQRDGIIAAACARGLPGEADQAVEVDCRHMSFVLAPRAIRAVLDALAMPIGPVRP